MCSSSSSSLCFEACRARARSSSKFWPRAELVCTPTGEHHRRDRYLIAWLDQYWARESTWLLVVFPLWQSLFLIMILLLNFDKLTTSDVLALLYTSIFGSAISYGVFFYNATRGSLTKLSSLTFLTPMFASVFGFIYLGETFTPLQLVGAVVTVAAIYMVNYKDEA
ncbi:WAT1-related protein, chloroplastic [Sesamum angolense]|uniref:WAT1-related protein, chloroplastic n=1 Tax=Sesamum angolense TaxID=2727404 RepID=A0AAE1XCV8_9LAMI|nr:WAT1-related protein, chloroplastic [Sesamum angolense]